MRILGFLFLFFSCGVLRAQAPEIHAAKLPGEPHHHLRIDNEFVRAYYVEVAPHDETQLHQHDYDYIYVSLGPADVVNAVLNKPDVHLLLKDGETRFTHGRFAHVARNLSDTPFRNITIELLKSSGAPQNWCALIVPNQPSAGCEKTTAGQQGGHGFSVETQLTGDMMRLSLVRLDPATEGAGAGLEADSLLVPFGDAKVEMRVNGEPPKLLGAGELAWIGKKEMGGVWNPGKNSATYLQLTFTSR
jgi:hypothetical protein